MTRTNLFPPQTLCLAMREKNDISPRSLEPVVILSEPVEITVGSVTDTVVAVRLRGGIRQYVSMHRLTTDLDA